MVEAILSVISGVLHQCHNPVCLESALHGLGHLVSACGTKAQAIIREFLDARGDSAGEALRAYAQAALTGCIL
ncbi:MAG: hypothetical protein IPK19_36790 [Chloroflexi bacterium]|nr:hypothetical protein [Chloroflexota bacterium]